MLSNMSVSRKLFLMLMAPIIGLLFFAGLGIQQKLSIMREMDELDALIEVSVQIYDVIHEIQEERGVGAGYLNNKDMEAEKFKIEIDLTDKSVQKLIELSKSDKMSVLSDDFRNALNKRIDAFQDLNAVRSRILSRTIATDEMLSALNKLNNGMLDLVVDATLRTDDTEIKNSMTSLVALQFEKEQSGLERAIGNATILRGSFTDDSYAAYIKAIAAEESFHNQFELFGPKESEWYKSIVAGTEVEEFYRMRRALLERGKIEFRSADWFSAATARIDLLKAVSDRVTTSLNEAGVAAVDRAKASLLIFSMIAAAAVGAALWLAYIVGRSVNLPLTKASDDTREISSQIVAAVSQQSASASETATAVTQTSTTVDEIRRTSEMTVDKAKNVLDVATRGQSAAQDGLNAITHGIEAMRRIRVEVEGIARNILELSEKNMQIGEIVQSVNALAEQSNLLAVNASIEAAKAGEHGKGFAVVAGEVKALAEQSKDATVQIRGMLAEIQKSSNAAVMVTEQGTKRVEEGAQLIEELGRTIQSVNRVNEESADAARQITAAANQQLVGIEQITSAMRNIEQAVKDNAAGIHQLEQSAQGLKSVSNGLGEIVKGRLAVHA